MTCVEVVSPGLLTTVQDRGRPGLAHLGVPPSGAADPVAYELGNRLVGNPPGAAALEATLDGPVLRFDVPTTIALTGATSQEVRTVEVLEVGRCVGGARTYVAVRGGLDVEPTLGSRSTDLLTGLGPAPLRTGDRLRIGLEPAEAQPTPPGTVPGFGLPDEPVLHVRPRPARRLVHRCRPRRALLRVVAGQLVFESRWYSPRRSAARARPSRRVAVGRARDRRVAGSGFRAADPAPAGSPDDGRLPRDRGRLFGRPVDCRPACTEAIRAVCGRRLASWRGCARSARPGARAHRRFHRLRGERRRPVGRVRGVRAQRAARRHRSRSCDEGAAAPRRGDRDRSDHGRPAACRRSVRALPGVWRLPFPGSRVRRSARGEGAVGRRLAPEARRSQRPAARADHRCGVAVRLPQQDGVLVHDERRRPDARPAPRGALGRGARDREVLAHLRSRQRDSEPRARVGA